jgi:hypothetical protein
MTTRKDRFFFRAVSRAIKAVSYLAIACSRGDAFINRERGTGNREQGTGNREQGIGNEGFEGIEGIERIGNEELGGVLLVF